MSSIHINRSDFERVKALLIHIEEQQNQAVRDLFSHVGADYDRGDLIVLNDSYLPELLDVQLPKQIVLSRYLPDKTFGIVVREGFF